LQGNRELDAEIGQVQNANENDDLTQLRRHASV
jgi:hypothetical protein